MAQSAATRVFNITELLEQILLEITPNKFDQGFSDNEPVVTSLFALQRINRTFCTTIQDSKTLRQRMLLSIPTRAPSPSALRPLEWFAATGGLLTKLPNHPHLYRSHPSDPKVAMPTLPCRCLQVQNPRFSIPSASWRKIPLLESRPSTFTFQVEVEYNSIGLPIPGSMYNVEWVLEWEKYEPTLGDFYDVCMNIIGRKKSQHLVRLKRAWPERIKLKRGKDQSLIIRRV